MNEGKRYKNNARETLLFQESESVKITQGEYGIFMNQLCEL